ncbi:MAG: hypothetical protein KQI62_10265 [Deltaproteobacteria bacterium]|nr:hypothetical protein [Deltaproteobacteria bacterium]
MAQGQTSAPKEGTRCLIPLGFAVAGCLLAGGLSLFWLAWTDGDISHWDHLVPTALLGAVCGLLTARLLPLRRETKPLWLRLCMHCHAVNPDSDQTPLSHDWVPVDQYLEKSLNAQVSHGICPDCVGKYYGDRT